MNETARTARSALLSSFPGGPSLTGPVRPPPVPAEQARKERACNSRPQIPEDHGSKRSHDPDGLDHEPNRMPARVLPLGAAALRTHSHRVPHQTRITGISTPSAHPQRTVQTRDSALAGIGATTWFSHLAGCASLVEKEPAMYAAFVTVTIDPGKDAEAQAMLASQVVPMVKQSEGLIAGYWGEPLDGKGLSVVIFDTEEHARAAAPPAGMRPPGSPVVVDTVDFREIIATA